MKIQQITNLVADAIKGKPAKLRSSLWPKVRDEHLKLRPTCEACGGTKNLIVHHLQSFHEHPELELLENNLFTLCEKSSINCHLLCGHLGDYHSINVDCVIDSAEWLKKIKARP
jgi:hypothetical protein